MDPMNPRCWLFHGSFPEGRRGSFHLSAAAPGAVQCCGSSLVWLPAFFLLKKNSSATLPKSSWDNFTAGWVQEFLPEYPRTPQESHHEGGSNNPLWSIISRVSVSDWHIFEWHQDRAALQLKWDTAALCSEHLCPLFALSAWLSVKSQNQRFPPRALLNVPMSLKYHISTFFFMVALIFFFSFHMIYCHKFDFSSLDSIQDCLDVRNSFQTGLNSHINVIMLLIFIRAETWLQWRIALLGNWFYCFMCPLKNNCKVVFFFYFLCCRILLCHVFLSGKYCSTAFLSVKPGEGSDGIKNACTKMSYALHLHFQITFIFKIHKNISKLCSGIEKPFYLSMCGV